MHRLAIGEVMVYLRWVVAFLLGTFIDARETRASDGVCSAARTIPLQGVVRFAANTQAAPRPNVHYRDATGTHDALSVASRWRRGSGYTTCVSGVEVIVPHRFDWEL